MAGDLGGALAPGGPLANGELDEKKDCVVLTSISTVALEKTAQSPDGHPDTPSQKVHAHSHLDTPPPSRPGYAGSESPPAEAVLS